MIVRLDDNARITIANSNTGQELWSLPFPQAADNLFFPGHFPLHIEHFDNIIVFYYGMDRSKKIEAYELESGKLLWEIGEHFDSVPTLVDGKIIAYRFDDGLMIYDAHNGLLMGRVTLTRTLNDNSTWQSRPVWLAGHENTIALIYLGSAELLTLQIGE